MEDRNYRRRRLLAGVRGCLRQDASPRFLVLFALLVSALPGAVIAQAAHGMGLSFWGPAIAVGLLGMWPIFVFVSRHLADRLHKKLNVLENLDINIAQDMALDIQASAKQWTPPSDYSQGVSAGLYQSKGKIGGGTGIIVVLVLALVSLGLWLIWDFMRYGPTLFSELIVDGCLAEKFPTLHRRATLESWKQNAFISTGIYFLLLAVTALLLGAVLCCIPTTGWGKP